MTGSERRAKYSAEDVEAALRDLVEAASQLGSDIPDHRCSPTEHEDAFWTEYHDARRLVGMLDTMRREDSR